MKLVSIVLVVLLLVPSMAAAAPRLAEWTVLVYCVTDNMLWPCVEADLNEMEAAGPGPDLNILVQVHRSRHEASRYRIVADDNLQRLVSPVVGQPAELDSGDHRTLVEFVRWGVAQAPSRRVMLILHGCLGNLGYGAPTTRGDELNGLLILAGLEGVQIHPERKLEQVKLERDWRKRRENGATYMGIREAGRGLAAIHQLLGRKIDIVGCDDSCDMTLEKFAEFRADVGYWIASVGFLPSDDWPYEQILGRLATDPGTDLDTFCRRAVGDFRIAYEPYCQLPYGFGATLSAVNLGTLESLLGQTRDLGQQLYKAVKKREPRYRLLDLRKQTLSFLSSDNLDLPELLRGLTRIDLGNPEIPRIAATVKQTVEQSLLAHWAGGRVYHKAGGISVTVSDFMGDYDRKKYALLAWSVFSRWNKLLDRLMKR